MIVLITSDKSVGKGSRSRQGVVLLVVITLLTLFAVVGIAFVLFSQSEAKTARVWRESETLQRPDMDPEMLLSYYLGQLIYGPNPANQVSQLRYQSLAENMYGAPGSTVPFNGTGRVHTNAAPGQDDYYQIDYSLNGNNPGRNPYQTFSPNVAYTYPDFNSLYLAAVRASDGAVLIPSFYRTNPQNVQSPIALRAKGLPKPDDGFCDVKNLADSPGLLNPTSGAFTPNDSVWMDIGFPVMSAPDGRQFKPLFAALVQDLDNRVNVNVHGHLMESTLPGVAEIQQGCYQFGRHMSDQGWGPWEVSLERILSATVPQNKTSITTMVNGKDTSEDGTGTATTGSASKTYKAQEDNVEATNIFIGKSTPAAGTYPGPAQYIYNGPRGRYDPTCWSAFCTLNPLPPQNTLDGVARYWLTRAGPFYSHTNFESEWVSQLPNSFGTAQMVTLTSGSSFPSIPGWYANGAQGAEMGFHALQFNFFNPTLASYSMVSSLRQDRTFPASNMEALLRYGDRGSPALTSELFQLCPNSFGNATTGAKTRRLVTTHAFDVDRPGGVPWVWPSPGAQYSNTTTPPSSRPIPFPNWSAPPSSGPAGDFTTAWQVNTTPLGPINLNRNLIDFPALSPYEDISLPANAADNLAFQQARADRQALANQIFNVLKHVTGANNNQPSGDAWRYLAQLAVNIVDYRAGQAATSAVCDFMTPLTFTNPQTNLPETVFGCTLPRLVINEVYCDLVNDPTDPLTGGKATKPYQVRFWVELLNPLEKGGGLIDTGKAILGRPTKWNAKKTKITTQGYAGHRLIIAQNAAATEAVLRKPGNTLGDLNFVGLPGSDATLPAVGQPPVLNPNIKIALMNYTNDASYSAPSYPIKVDIVNGANDFYVIGPNAPFPGSPANLADPTTLNIDGSSATPANPMYYTVPLTTGPTTTNWPAVTTAGNTPSTGITHTLLLQRLACPFLPWNDPTPVTGNNPPGTTSFSSTTLGMGGASTDWTTYNPALPYNPYVTIDYLALHANAVNDRVANTSMGARTPLPATASNLASCYSVGRTQPYAATQLADQKPANSGLAALVGQPQTTLVSNQNLPAPTTTINWSAMPPQPGPYRWLPFINRALISPMELLEVSGYPPHLLTQQFIWPASYNGATASTSFKHRVPWFDEDLPAGQSHLLYRALEYLRAGVDIQMAPLGGRAIGRININTIWDPDTFKALCDPGYTNYSSGPYSATALSWANSTAADQALIDQQINTIWPLFLQSRTPSSVNGVAGPPGPNDRPFMPLANPYYGAGSQALPTPCLNGASINDTFLRVNPTGALDWEGAPKRLFTIDPTVRQPAAGVVFQHPYFEHELMRKIYNNTTTRSNVFALWLTVGFFEVTAQPPGQPPTLGLEIGRSENRHVRHRMFAIIDRTNLTLNPQVPKPNPNPNYAAGPRPFFLQTVAQVTGASNSGPGDTTIQLPLGTGGYEDYQYQLGAGMQLSVGLGPTQEIVTIASYNPLTQTVTLTGQCQQSHTPGEPVTNVGTNATSMGNPGPQALFDPRNPTYRGLVRYFSIIE